MKKNWGELHSRFILLLTSFATRVRPAVFNGTPWRTFALGKSLHRPTPDGQTRSLAADHGGMFPVCVSIVESGRSTHLSFCDLILRPELEGEGASRVACCFFIRVVCSSVWFHILHGEVDPPFCTFAFFAPNSSRVGSLSFSYALCVNISWCSCVPSRVPVPLPAVGQVGVRARPWPLAPHSQRLTQCIVL